MIHLWRTPAKFYESIMGDDLSKYIGLYNKEVGPDYSLFSGRRDGRLFSLSKDNLVFTFETTMKELCSYDVLANDATFIIVNERVRKMLTLYADNDIQFLSAKIICVDGELSGYSIVNILSRVAGIDRVKSKCEFSVVSPKSICGFEFGAGTLVYHHDCLGKHNIAIEKEFGSFVLISQSLKDALCGLYPPIKEVSFILPEDTEW